MQYFSFLVHRILLVLFISPTMIYSQELISDSITTLLLHFNNSINGSNGEVPLSSQNLAFSSTQYRFGQGLDATNPNSNLVFSSSVINNSEGTLEVWIYPTWSGSDNLNHFIMGYNGFSFLKDGGTNLVLYINTIQNGNQAWKYATYNVANWGPNKWYHLAITWKNGEVRSYLNGLVMAESKGNFTLDVPNNPSVSFLSSESGVESCQCYVDELRLSNKVRTPQDIYDDYLKGLNAATLTLGTKSNSQIDILETWNLYLYKSGYWKVPTFYLSNGSDTIVVPNEVVSWAVSDTAKLNLSSLGITALKQGTAILTATFNSQSISFPINILKPPKAPTYESKIDPFLATPAFCATNEIPIVIISYIPTMDSINLDLNEFDGVPYGSPSVQTVKHAKDHILGIMKHAKFSLEEGSKFRGYKNPMAKPYLGYKVIDYINFYEAAPRGFPTPDGNAYAYDFHQILNRINGKYYVDSLGVIEFWVINVHTNVIIPTESNMSSPTTPNISNSLRREDDMPKYSKTYYMYNYNMARTGNEAVHNHGHQLEAMLTYVIEQQDGNSNLLWKDFAGYNSIFPNLRNGDTHHTPNSISDYDYFNVNPVASDIMDWSPAGGNSTLVSKVTWDTLHYNWPANLYPITGNPAFQLPDAESNWYIMWMQSFPGEGNKIPYGSRYMSNWWKFVSDWDNNYTVGLHQANVESDPDCPLKTLIKTKGILAGAYNASGDSMTTSLRSLNLIPTKCPYDTSIILNSIPLSMVDWIKVDLVDTISGDTIYGTQCACLLKNGVIQNIAGDTILKFAGMDKPFISVRLKHRNHLSARSHGIANVFNSPLSLDFRTGANLYIDPTITGPGFNNAGLPEQFIGTRYALWPGDVNGDGQIKYQGSSNDRGLILSAIGGTVITNTVSGYHPADVNLNGQVKYQGSGNDRGIVLSSIGGSVITKITKAHD